MEQNITENQNKVETAVPAVVSNPTTTENKEVIEEDITIIADEPIVKEVPKEAPVIPTVVTPVAPKEEPEEEVKTEPEVKEEKKEIETKASESEKKDKKFNLWLVLAIIFFLATIVLAFLYFTQKEYMTVVIVGKGDNVKVEKIEKGQTVTKPSISEEGFLGWYSDNKEFDFNTKIEKDYVIIGKYDERATYTVTFNTDGGNEIASVKVKEKELVKEPTAPTKTGFIFTEWTLDGVAYDFNTPVTKDMELKATWRVNDNTVMVRFDSNGGSNVASQKVRVGTTVKKPNNPTKSGYNFKEWQLNGAAFDFKTTIDSDTTLTAFWTEKKKFTINFDSNGGSVVATKIAYENEAVGTLPTPTKSELVFSRWTLNGKTFDSKSKITSDVTVVAEWKTVDEANYDKALAAIKSSYDVTKDGQVINVTSTGCTITHDEIKTINSTITFHITCGKKTGTKQVKANVKLPTYTYTVTDSGNMVNSYVSVKNVTSGTICLKDTPEECFEIVNGKAIVENKYLTSNPVFLMKITGDDTTYTVKKG